MMASCATRCRLSGTGLGLSEALGTTSPVGYFRFVDLIAAIVDRRQARRFAGRALDVDDPTADAADQMVMVVADAVLEPCRRPGRLDAANQSFGDEQIQRVVDRLERDRADLRSDDGGDAVRADMWLARDRAQDGQPLRGHLDAASSKEGVGTWPHRT